MRTTRDGNMHRSGYDIYVYDVGTESPRREL